MASLTEIYDTVENKNTDFFGFNPIVPKEFLYKKVKKSEMKKISEGVDALETLIDNFGVEILDRNILKNEIFTEAIILNKLQNEKRMPYYLKEEILNELINDEILTEGFIDSLSDKFVQAKQTTKDAVIKTSANIKQKVTDWMNVAIDEAKKVVMTFTKSMGEFGAAFMEFIKGFGDIDFKAAWFLLKDGDFIGLVKSAGEWLMKRATDGLVMYQKIYATLDKGIFKNLAGSKPIVALRDFLTEHVQQELEKLISPNSDNVEIKKIIEDKYHGDVKSAMNDKEVIRLILADEGVGKTLAKYGFRTAIGALLAYIAWETWNVMVFKGELIYDYDFSRALDAIAGKFDVAGWFLDDKGGFETLLWLIAGKLGMGSIASDNTTTNIKLAVVVTIIVIWIKKNPTTWKQIKESDFGKKVVKVYNDSKNRIVGTAEKVVSQFKEVKLNILMRMGFIKKSGVPA